jgi:hypothetical protein
MRLRVLQKSKGKVFTDVWLNDWISVKFRNSNMQPKLMVLLMRCVVLVLHMITLRGRLDLPANY